MSASAVPHNADGGGDSQPQLVLALGCHAVWDTLQLDWDACFRARVLNTFFPTLALALSVLALLTHSLRSNTRKRTSEVQVAKLDPAASSIYLPARTPAGRGSAPPPASSSSSATPAALQVFRTENSVILNEVHSTPLVQVSTADAARYRRLEALKRGIEVLGAGGLIASHAAAWAIARGQGDHSALPLAATAAAALAWPALWLYFALLSGWTMTMTRSLYAHKALLVGAYVLVTASNLRSAVLQQPGSSGDGGYVHANAAVPLAALQLALALLVAAPTLFFPLKRRTPHSLQAIHRTMRTEARLATMRTALPTPRRRAGVLATEDEEHMLDASDEDGAANDLVEQARLALLAGTGASSSTAAPPPPSPELYASLYSRCFFGFVTPELVRHFREQYRPEQVPDLLPDDKAAAVVSAFRARSGSSGGRGSDSGSSSGRKLTLSLFRHFWPQLTYQFVTSFAQAILSLSSPIGLQYILAFIAQRSRAAAAAGSAHEPQQQQQPPLHMAVLYASLMFAGQVLFAILASQALMTGRKICINLRAILITEIVTKALRRRNGSAKNSGSGGADEADAQDAKGTDTDSTATDGQIVNLISVDVFKVSEVCAYLHFVIPMAPVQVALSLYFLTRLLGWSAVIGFGALLASIPFQTWVSTFYIALQKELLGVSDARLDLTTEVLNCIKTVKFFAWESSFQSRIEKIRDNELWVLQKRFVATVLQIFCFRGLPVAIIVLTFSVHTAVFHRPLPAEVAFSSLAFFTALRSSIDTLPSMMANIFGSLVSLRRIDTFLREEETAKYEQLLCYDAPNGDGEDDSFGASRHAHGRTYVGFSDGASFTYVEDDDKIADGSAFVLRGLDIVFPPGQLSIIAGAVGSGKSTLLLSLLGETRRLNGRTYLPCPIARALVPIDEDGLSDTVAYCSQTPWLLGTSIKENILFGSPYDPKRYHAVIKACALEPDLNILEYNDETEVGEKGTSLSGGQKARVSLARALYSSARVLLIDDALSALDATTSEFIYRNYLKGPLVKDRTVIMVTHAVSLCMSGAAFVVALHEGNVAAQGTPAEVSAAGIFDGEGPLHLELEHEKEAEQVEQTIEVLDEGQLEAEAAVLKKKMDKKAAHAEEETYAKGAVSFNTYLLYFANFAANNVLLFLFWVSIAGLFIASKGADIWSTAWLRRWAASYDSAPAPSVAQTLGQFFTPPMSAVTQAGSFIPRYFITPAYETVKNVTPSVFASSSDQTVFFGAEVPTATITESTGSYLQIYAALSLLFISIDVFKDSFVLAGSVSASRRIFKRLMAAVLSAKPGFFDKTPVGRVMNRLSKDMEAIDQEAAGDCVFFLDVFLQSIAIIGIVVFALPIFGALSIVIVGVYFAIGALYITSSRDLKRIESVQRSPIFTLVGEIIGGSVAIRAFGDAGRFTRHCLRLIDRTNGPFYFLWCANRWLSLRVDTFAALISFVVALFLLLTPGVDAGLAGFTLSYSIMLVDSVLWVVRVYSMVEINMNSVERVQEYLSIEPERFAGQEPPAYWPSDKGSIVIENLSVRYSAEFPRALDSLSLEIKAGRKVGIVGRTGSGKSTLTLALFRFLEAETGRITIDGIDISRVPLKTLRSRLTVIPQHPDIFSGTVRSNLDPFGYYEDADLWNALERCKLATRADVIAASRGPSRQPSRPGSVHEDDDDGSQQGRVIITSLDMRVEQGGKNFSQGQRQLLALARGLLKLRDSRILILDESTASLDAASDAQIQETIRNEMSNATILTVAHRLRTICDFDLVLVLDKGRIHEYDSPYNLLKDTKSSFHDLAQRSGEFNHLVGMAERKHAQDAAASSA
ncbi:hypothetical protein K437DRAFT_292771 [Tilletiaria anomala UBC 951]|uniref:P-loop containing nucleoside triphosphate hydrolase protein n=1 Tax=Tilletiaria anomala (strain ATCC 24038 / CBS 436.72 / UBC 951) TaxID=1037660 RepID=A0A066WPH1_TILAU|nr:uncharacterized protein K437DRAFT_292771 [Tilletiaria anomala UBC 951]KDN52874.1 hypothetical protein K437DRAFT_292771 [Tilletiaria anomala UBC 951]